MLVDATTLSDLEVFQDAAGRGGLFALLDETETQVGRTALRHRLERPHSDARAIIETQRAVAFFSSHPGALRLTDRSIKALRRYQDSNVVLLPEGGWVSATVGALWFSLRYRSAYLEVEEGVMATVAFLRASIESARGLLSLDPPSEIRALAGELLTSCESCGGAVGKGPAEILRQDRLFRGPGRAALLRSVDCIGELDALRSMARATGRWGWAIPEIAASEQFVFEGEGLFHPFVEGAIGNPIELTGGEPMVFLTGPNMAGKTTYLRSAALVVLLAQVGMGVPARRVRVTPVDVLLTSLNPSDNLRSGLSFFFSEVLRVRDAATHLAAGKRCFVLFDEVFKGTNVKDALDASETVILGFAKAEGSGFIFSSHLVELAETLRSNGRVRFHYFDGRLVSGRAEYSYQVREGVSDQRFGLQLLNEARIPELIARIGA